MPRPGPVARSAVAALLLLVVTAPTSASETPSIVSEGELDRALAAQTSRQLETRARIEGLLARSDVREVAELAGIDLQRAAAAVAALDDDELLALAAMAEGLDATLVGGQRQTVSGGTGNHFPILYAVILVALVVGFLLL